MNTTPPRASRPLPKSMNFTSPRRRRPRPKPLVYQSPRIQEEDDELFLPNSSDSLQQPEDRWKHMSRLAGAHQQDPTVLDLSRRHELSPPMLKVGVPPAVAARVQTLHLSIPSNSDYPLPEWIDVVGSMFFTLQHLYLGRFDGASAKHKKNHSLNDSEAARMRRLYILYRLPDLLSIDGRPVTQLERELARPSSPSGYRVNRDDWLRNNTATRRSNTTSDSEHDEYSDDYESATSEEDEISHGDAVEVSLYGVIKMLETEPPDDDGEARETSTVDARVKAAEHRHRNSSSPLNYTKSVETAMREMRKTSKANDAFDSGLEPFPTCGVEEFSAIAEQIKLGNGGEEQSHGSRSVSSSSSRELDTSGNPQDVSPPKTSSPEPLAAQTRSLSSPFPIQFRSKSFNNVYPSAKRATPPKMHRRHSSGGLDQDLAKATIDEALPSASFSAEKTLRGSLSKSDRPPPFPSRRYELKPPTPPPKPPKRRSNIGRWRAKLRVRSTSIVDSDDEDSSTDEEDELIETS